MMKLNCSILLLLLVALGCQSGKEVSQSYFQIRDSYAQDMSAFAAKMKAASEEERKAFMKEMPDRKAYLDTLLHFAHSYPDEDFTADVWVEIFKSQVMMGSDSIFQLALAELSTKHASSEHLTNIDPRYLSKSRSPNIGAFMETVMEKTDSRNIKGIFTLAYAEWLTFNQKAPQYDLEKGLALFNEVISAYADVTATYGPDDSQISIGSKAEDAKRGLTSLAVGQPAPEIISEDLNGEQVRLSEHQGKVVMLDIWATWCGPCIGMIPDETEMVKRLESQPFELISISIDRQLETVKKFQQKTPMPWTNWFNGEEGGILTQWNIHQYPTIILLDKEGIIRHRFDQAVKQEELDTIIDQLLQS